MSDGPRIVFIGAGSTVFMKNVIADILRRAALAGAHVALVDVDAERLAEAGRVAEALVAQLGVSATFACHHDQRAALAGADFVIAAFQVGGYMPATAIDFDIPTAAGLRQTIGDTMGLGGIMRGLRTVPHLWALCEDMMELCPEALLLQYVNPMAINTWSIARRYPGIRQVGLCHSVPLSILELSQDLQIPVETMRYRCAGINHMAFFLELSQVQSDGSLRDLYPALREGYAAGVLPRPDNRTYPRCANLVRYEMMGRLGYYVSESSEHFAEYTPWFIKQSRPDLIEKYQIPLDEYPKRCEEQIDEWKARQARLDASGEIDLSTRVEEAADIVHAVWTDTPVRVAGNVPNHGYVPQLPEGCAVEVPCFVDGNGVQPSVVSDIPPQLVALMRTNVNVQELTVAALIEEKREHIYHAAMLDPHTGAELDLEQIWQVVDKLIQAHGVLLPHWVHARD
ncbi:alpha-galactosidase [Aliiruegeria haliotis]|uniref:Alpha-galactosidase n=1 Tax=Aliiruegeria haliotis TaxID=1280846 RepID=A0A2T0RW71_9RHOB|nr:alpha-glucosidase/alpha-galactosidase [Aliiruegeria haliotis]PRY25397.1 alpha-galactosidase [Aliiruegeria haliotis]